jgi:hypothetical protein
LKRIAFSPKSQELIDLHKMEEYVENEATGVTGQSQAGCFCQTNELK